MYKKLILAGIVLGISFAVFAFTSASTENTAVVNPIEISYGLHPLQKFDLYHQNISPDAKKRDVVINVHGGGWSAGDKRQFTLPMLRMRDLALDLGYAVIAPNYRLAPANPYPAAITDLHAVIEWIAANKTLYNLTGDYVVLGESAGANLGGYVSADGLSDLNLKGFIGFAGYYKIDDETDTSPVGTKTQDYLGCIISQCGTIIYNASPWWNSVITPPMLFVHGDHDSFVSSTQSQHMAERNGLSNSTVMIVEGGLHTGPTMVSTTIDNAASAFLAKVFN